ncbi:calcium-binding protein [Natrinema gelatinilyticum]|uniref:calcium-binding protein n=1 Tax=Natrinema gelatinilyticum TaxID=2961571 RepID=UPI0020C5284F|nr:calcium-binding protein [Natrinema gelatinilyticum]
MTDENHESEHETTGQSLMRKGTVATATAGTAAIGAAATATAQDDDDDDALVFAYDYFPGESFEVISTLEQSTTVDVLRVGDQTVPEISQPDEWSGYIIRYDDGDGDSAGITTFLFTRSDDLSEDDSAEIGEDAQIYSTQLNLLSADLD